MANRAKNNSLNSPISTYEVHLGSWKRVPEEGNRWLTYREMAPLLADYVHGKGLKLGIYSGPGPKTCAGYAGSLGHEEQDAKMYAEWGIEIITAT
jgi:hypothetical protein